MVACYCRGSIGGYTRAIRTLVRCTWGGAGVDIECGGGGRRGARAVGLTGNSLGSALGGHLRVTKDVTVDRSILRAGATWEAIGT